MRAGEPLDIPNPFSLERRAARRPNGTPISKAVKFFILVAICFCATIAIGSQSRRWLLTSLTSDFETLAPAKKKQRLLQIADFGALAIEPLVHSLADDNREVARAAYDLLRHSQADWASLGRGESCTRHAALVDALNSLGVNIPDDRTGWATGLLKQTIAETANQSDETSATLYNRANDTLALFMLSGRPGPSVLSDEPYGPPKLVVHPTPLPVVVARSSEPHTQGLAGQARAATDARIPANAITANRQTQSTLEAPGRSPSVQSVESTTMDAAAPSVYRSSSSIRLQTVQPGETVVLHPTRESQETSYQAIEVRPQTELVDSPLETFDDASVIKWLGSEHPALREKARGELIRRGFNERQITLGTRITTGDVQTRIALVDTIARSASMDPRPWLLMMMDDDNREVQLRVISVLATMNDPAVRQQLRLRVDAHQDPIVAARLRRVLNLR